MIEQLEGLPDGVIGFRGHGKIHADDYQDVLVPAIDAQLAAGDDLRLVMVFEEWDGVSLGGAWHDLEMGTKYFRKWERIALVTDVEWMHHLTHLFGWMTPGEVKQFHLADRDAAIEWAAGS